MMATSTHSATMATVFLRSRRHASAQYDTLLRC